MSRLLEAVGLMGLFGLMGFILGRCTATLPSSDEQDAVVVRDTVTVIRVDTIREVETRLVTEEVLRVDTLVIGPLQFEPGFDDEVATFEIVRREFEGENYRAFVSGPKVQDMGPWLDSIDVQRDIVETVITVREKERRKRWGLGAQIGATWDFKTGRPAPYVGVGVSYSLFNW